MNDRDGDSFTYDNQRRDQGALGAKKHGGMPPGQAPRGEGVF